MILTRAIGGKASLVLEVFCNPVRDVFACFWVALFPNKIHKWIAAFLDHRAIIWVSP
jgi:hypothetical protein